jgi:hypothetical protein
VNANNPFVGRIFSLMSVASKHPRHRTLLQKADDDTESHRLRPGMLTLEELALDRVPEA